MKLLCFFWLILINTCLVRAQHVNELTKEVFINFSKNHPNVSNVHWEKLDSNLKVLFNDKGYDVEKTYTIWGKLLRTKLQMDVSFLPKSSSDFVARFYNKNNIYKAFKLFDDFSNTSYLIELDSNRLFFDINGIFLKFEALKKNKK